MKGYKELELIKSELELKLSNKNSEIEQMKYSLFFLILTFRNDFLSSYERYRDFESKELEWKRDRENFRSINDNLTKQQEILNQTVVELTHKLQSKSVLILSI